MRSNAACPASPPISVSDSGIEATSWLRSALLTASVKDCTKVRLASNEPAGKPLAPYILRVYAINSSMRMIAGPNSLRSVVRSSAPGATLFSSAVFTIAYPSCPPSCAAMFPQSVRVVIPFTSCGRDGLRSVPTMTAIRAVGSSLTSAASRIRSAPSISATLAFPRRR